jgi:Fanconi anemia group M protein
MQHEKYRLTVDTREQDNVIKMLDKMDIKYNRAALLTGDYQMEDSDGNVVTMERKTIPDLVGSLMSGRLEEQMRRLADEKCPMLLITGSFGDYKKFAKFSKFTVDQLHGAIASCIVKYGLRCVIWVQSVSDHPNSNGLGIGCKVLAKVSEGKLDKIPPRKIKRRGNVAQIEIIHILFGVPVNVAEGLLKRFGSIRDILDADDKELLGVKGMGPTRTITMRKLLGDIK